MGQLAQVGEAQSQGYDSWLYSSSLEVSKWKPFSPNVTPGYCTPHYQDSSLVKMQTPGSASKGCGPVPEYALCPVPQRWSCALALGSSGAFL